MVERGKLAQEARKRGYDSIADMVSDGLSQSPSIGGAAAFCKVAPNAISVWLGTNGYAVVREVKAWLVRADSGFPVNEGE